MYLADSFFFLLQPYLSLDAYPGLRAFWIGDLFHTNH